MFPKLLDPSTLIALAGTVQILGYLLINQTYLRLTMLCSTSIYIVYYFHAADEPLWGAIGVSSMTLITILIGLAVLYFRNARFSVPDQHQDIYHLFDELQPGDFRKVMRLAKREIIETERTVTKEGEDPDTLIYVTKGTFRVEKGDVHFDVPGPTFIGEVAYLRNKESAATTILPPGVEVVIWSRETLRRQIKSSPRLKLALDALISRDLATKVSLAVSPDAKRLS